MIFSSLIFFHISLQILFYQIFFLLKVPCWYECIKTGVESSECLYMNRGLSLFFFAKFFRPYVYSFCQIFQALRLFKALCLFFFQKFPGPTYISCLTSILECRVKQIFRLVCLLIINTFYRCSFCQKSILWTVFI